ncbi:MAG: sigma-70 family RNA polymerase sigma factor [Deltaproteobacteria bacterium]|nr:sigma-70 family RNA polymerase sigma factor [Deltaproteobacteria bacterium]
MSTARHRSSAPAAPATETGALVVAHDRAPSDETLVKRALASDAWAEEALFRRYAAQVLVLAERLLRRRSLADDVLQDTFADAFTKLETLRDPSAFRSWLFGIAVRRVRRQQRKLAMRRALGLDRSLDDATLAMVASSDCSPERLAELGRIDRILATLHPDQRNAWMLRRVEGEKLEDIASIVGCSLATAKRRIQAADVLVRGALGESR